MIANGEYIDMTYNLLAFCFGGVFTRQIIFFSDCSEITVFYLIKLIFFLSLLIVFNWEIEQLKCTNQIFFQS